jgi:SAM-dependent methyltransferase
VTNRWSASTRRATEALVVALVLWNAAALAAAQDVPFLESPESVVDAMLRLAEVGEADLVYDLGSGDGRIVIAAARDRGARGVGIESDPDLVQRSVADARAAGVEERVRFVRGDLFEEPFGEATVVMLYLQPKVNRRLRPLLDEQLAPGTRVVSHRYEIPDWTPLRRVKVEGRALYLYVVQPPDRVGPGPTSR